MVVVIAVFALVVAEAGAREYHWADTGDNIDTPVKTMICSKNSVKADRIAKEGDSL